jgi:NAD(P)-dependent dehydrogenase (short-subunit alcohol dehydrogenase family)
MGNLSGKTALVTGSSRGIGKAIAERFGKLGADVVVNYAASKEPALATVEAIEKNGVRAIAVQADLAKVDDIHRLFARSMEHVGRLDIVVANAGISNSSTRQSSTSRKRISTASLVSIPRAHSSLYRRLQDTSRTTAALSMSDQAPPDFRRPDTIFQGLKRCGIVLRGHGHSPEGDGAG